MPWMPLGWVGASGGGQAATYELIQTQVLAANATTVTLSSIPSTYKHLQIRAAILTTAAPGEMRFYKNAVTSGYWAHFLEGAGSTPSSNYSPSQSGFYFWYNNVAQTSSKPLTAVIDYLDYTNTSKNPTVRGFIGDSAVVRIISGSIADTSTPTSLTFTTASGQYAIGTRISVYGVRG